MNNETSPQKPFTTFRCGALQVAVWKTTKDNTDYYSATPTRAYTTDNGKSWAHACAFGERDLPTIAALLTRAWEWILANKLRPKSKPAGDRIGGTEIA